MAVRLCVCVCARVLFFLLSVSISVCVCVSCITKHAAQDVRVMSRSCECVTHGTLISMSHVTLKIHPIYVFIPEGS